MKPGAGGAGLGGTGPALAGAVDGAGAGAEPAVDAEPIDVGDDVIPAAGKSRAAGVGVGAGTSVGVATPANPARPASPPAGTAGTNITPPAAASSNGD
ncbi:hypothetical protein A9W94_04580 [Mycobacterium asiaticum]|nr:hypothetical protein A9W94_04580 [Mycobacterium asiaticum]